MSIKKKDLDPSTREFIKSLTGGEVISDKKGGIRIVLDKEISEDLAKAKTDEKPTLVKSILNILDGGDKYSIERLAFTQDPSQTDTYANVYKTKNRGLPEGVLKRIVIQDDLVATCVTIRSNQVAQFGRPRPDRFSLGYVFEPDQETIEKLEHEKDLDKKIKQKEELQERMAKVSRLLLTCGHTNDVRVEDRLTFSQFLWQTTRNALTVGRIAVEIIEDFDIRTGKKSFHSFRPIDAGTIFKAVPQKGAAASIRKLARDLIEKIKNKRLLPDKFEKDEYTWIQVIEAKPVQAFTDKECLVHNFYPVPDVELDGYPITPIDTVVTAVTTHLNIQTHNKKYFENGRASRGMLILKSSDVDANVVTNLRQQFNASINSANNAWRMPVFGIGPEDDLTWNTIDSGTRDMEFQYLSDQNARIILAAFQMSPDEIPGWSYLSRGTTSQAISESGQEYKLEAARDIGIRPLLRQFEDFININIIPLLDPVLASCCTFKLVGLDSDTPEKQAILIQQDSALHMSYDEILQRVDKRPVGREMGGELPLNPQYQQLLDKYFTVGEILERFCGRKDASKDPMLQYFRDPFWNGWQQFMLQKQQLEAQAQQAAQQQQQQQQQPDPNAQQDQQEPPSDLSRSVDMAIDLLTKSEKNLPSPKRRLLAHQRKIMENFVEGLELDIKEANNEIVKATEKHLHKK